MAFGKIHEQFWDDSRVRALPERTRLFMLYLLSCRHKNRLGCYVLDPNYAAADLQWSAADVTGCITQLEEIGRVKYDAEHRMIFVRQFLKYNKLENAKVVTGAISELRGLPASPLFHDLLTALQQFKLAHYTDVVTELTNRIANDIPNGIGNGIGNDTGNRMPYSGPAHPFLSRSLALAGNQAVTTTEPEPQPEPQPDPSRAPAREPEHTREATHENGDGGTDELSLVRVMGVTIGEYAETIRDPARRKSFEAEAEILATGDDYTAWINPREGAQVDWAERPRLLKVAIAKFKSGERDRIRTALQLAIQQQIDPLPLRTSNAPPPDSDAGKLTASLPRGRNGKVLEDGIYRPKGSMADRDTNGPTMLGDSVTATLERIIAKSPTQLLQERVDAWKQENPDDTECMREDIAAELEHEIERAAETAEEPETWSSSRKKLEIDGRLFARVRERLSADETAEGST